MSKKVTVTKAYIDSLKAERARLKSELEEVKLDRDKHRNYWVKIYREVISIHGRGQHVSCPWIMESMAKHFNNVKSWYWG
ncbi:MAG: hypothetical protein OM95_07030 [Bdellovibrio sp. ArHS]|nr:MAG: hypothetical protein OM95_07030 [Bdellovibrio sp. ArHS]